MRALSRLLQSLAILALVSFCVFCLIGLMPGDPVDLMAAGNPQITPEDIERLRAAYGLDQPLTQRYLTWLGSALTGDFGYSRLFGVGVLEALWPCLVATLCMTGAALLLTLMLALPLGVYCAQKPNGALDRICAIFCFSGVALPTFWVSLLFILLFAVTLGWLPSAASLDHPVSLVLPVCALALSNLAVYIRHVRSAMIAALSLPHIKTARAKGCTPARVLWHHAFRGVLPTVTTLLMLDLAGIFSGALTVETVFAYPGMGKMTFDAVMGNDYNLALVAFLLLTAMVLFFSVLADALYGFLDPRIKAVAG